MGGAISNQFKNTLVEDVVNRAYNRVGAGDEIPMSKGAKNQMGWVDTDGNGRISRYELSSALKQDRLALSLENAGRDDGGLSRKVVNLMDAEDGIQGGTIRVSGNNIDAGTATNNLASGNWVVGKALYAKGSKPTLEIHQNADGPKITLPN